MVISSMYFLCVEYLPLHGIWVLQLLGTITRFIALNNSQKSKL
jgi:hypothetical protein